MDSKHSSSASASSAQLLAGPADQPRSHRQTDCLTRLPLPEFVETMAQTAALAEQTLIKARWRDGVRCPHCNSADIRKEDAREEGCATAFRCGSCAKTFTVRTNHFTEYPPTVPFQTWLLALYLMVSEPQFLSEQQMAHYLGVDQAIANLMIHSIHWQMRDADPMPLGSSVGVLKVEVDESYWPKHQDSAASERFTLQLYMIVLLERSSRQVRTTVVSARTIENMLTFLRSHDPGEASVFYFFTDGLGLYPALVRFLRRFHGVVVIHGVVDHSAKEYVNLDDPDIHINGAESFFAWARRALSNVEYSQENLARYTDHIEFIFNHRLVSVVERMERLMSREHGPLTPGRIQAEQRRFPPLPSYVGKLSL